MKKQDLKPEGLRVEVMQTVYGIVYDVHSWLGKESFSAPAMAEKRMRELTAMWRGGNGPA